MPAIPDHSLDQRASSFAWVNTQVLANSLDSGDLDLATAVSQFNAIVREVLRIIEEQSNIQTNSLNETKIKYEKMEKLIADLSEKCQGMQQALLYKEEKYDEKCREVERYKLICELSARSAVDDDRNFGLVEDDGCSVDDLVRRSRELSHRKGESTHAAMHNLDGAPSSPSEHMAKNLRKHVKITKLEPTGENDYTDTNRQASVDRMTVYQKRPASDYLGGPSRSYAKPSSLFAWPDDATRRFSSIGGINTSGPRTSLGPIPFSELPRPDHGDLLHSNSRVKVELTGQKNEVMSSSRNAVDQMKQKFTEKDLHRQMAGGCWTRMSRRRKEWPF